MKHILYYILLIFGFQGLNAQNITISGTITDQSSGETLIGATVMEAESGKGTVSNAYGFYSLEFPTSKDDSVTLISSYIGYQNKIIRISTQSDQQVNIALDSGVDLTEIVVEENSFRDQLRSTQMSVEQVSVAEAKLIPAFMGEVDILKTIQLKPGISSGSEGSTGLFVRGGSPDQNLIVLDEALVYNPNHLFGFFSTFNADAIKNVEVYKGGFPAEYGGRVSSVIDVKLRDGNDKSYHASGGIGLISSRLTVEGPLVKEKSSFIVSGRRTYVDLMTNAVNQANKDNEDYSPIPAYYFYDLNAKLNYKLNDNNRFFLSGYFGRDKFSFDDDEFNFGFDWGNATGTARWNHIFNHKLFSNTTFTFSDYNYEISNELTGFSFELGSKVQDVGIKSDFYWALNDKHDVKFGLNATYHQFEVGRLQAGSDDGEISFSAGDDLTGYEYAAYISDEIQWSEKFNMNVGLRLSGFYNETNYLGVEPRIAANYQFSPQFSGKISYAHMRQYVHLVSTASLALPTDIWHPSTERIKPQKSDQIAIGGSYLFGDGIYLTNEYYYKWLDNQIEFANFAELFANNDLEEEFIFGKGRGYGMEIGLEKRTGDLQGWIGYTLGYVERDEFADINDGKAFFPVYDRRHDFTTVLIYNINRRLSASATWVYGSGDRAWMPVGRIVHQGIPGTDIEPFVTQFQDPRNEFRKPDYHRLDLGLVIKFFPKWGESDLTFSIYNAYNRRNVFFLTLGPEYSDDSDIIPGVQIPDKVVAEQVSLFPILPAITWNFKF